MDAHSIQPTLVHINAVHARFMLSSTVATGATRSICCEMGTRGYDFSRLSRRVFCHNRRFLVPKRNDPGKV